MDKTQNTGALSFLAKWAMKVIVCNAHVSPACCSTPRNKIRGIYMQHEYTSTPTTAYKCTKGRRLNFCDPKLLDLGLLEDESDDFSDEHTSKCGGISFQSIAQMFLEWSRFGLEQPKDGREAAGEHEEQQSDESSGYIHF